MTQVKMSAAEVAVNKVETVGIGVPIPETSASNDYGLKLDRSRDALITDFGKITLQDRYLLPGEDFQGLFARVAKHYSDDHVHAQRLYDYISKHWFMPATPVLTNGGTERGLPISCFLNEVQDSLDGIAGIYEENIWLAAGGGGIGTYWGLVRSIGEDVRGDGKSSGSTPFIAAMNGISLAVSQGLRRRGSAAVYKPVWHPEIEEFVEMRRPTGGDPSRKSLNLHHGVVIPDEFMHAVENDDNWELRSPKDGKVMSLVRARDLWIRILNSRIETGEPYLLFIDNVNKQIPETYKRNNLYVKTSNLCNEITLATGLDQHNKQRTAVCCLSSLNLETYDEWKDNPVFIEDVMRFLDNVLQDFIDKASSKIDKARYSASRERSVGLGVMGFHSFLQSKMVPMESAMAKAWNNKIFKHIKEEADKASHKLAKEKGTCPDAAEVGLMERFTHKLAIAPTASISIIAGNSSPGIEPYNSNAFTQKTLSGSFNVRNKHLSVLFKERGMDTDDIWSSIMNHEGSIQHLDFLTQEEKDVFKTAFEIDQRWILDLAADRTPYICQSQSLNIFIPADIHKRDLHMLHYTAWKRGLKGMYYNRSKSLQRADKVSLKADKAMVQLEIPLSPPGEERKDTKSANNNSDDDNGNPTDYDECLACQ